MARDQGFVEVAVGALPLVRVAAGAARLLGLSRAQLDNRLKRAQNPEPD